MTMWVDDFTSPELHERWQLMEGTYTPPGLTDAAVLGPVLGDSFEVTVAGNLHGGFISIPILTDGFEQIIQAYVDAAELRLDAFGEVRATHPVDGPVTLRRADGQWALLAGGEVLQADPALGGSPGPLSFPDTHTGPAHLAVSASGATVTHIGYTTDVTDGPSTPGTSTLWWGGAVEAMWWGGPVQAVYMGSTLVWAAIITVTPAAPTFHDGEPWVTLPDVEGVTYSMSGTPGYNESVTVTATAQAGYELVGTASWSHTFGPPPRYVASDSGGVRPRLTYNVWTTINSHTVSATGTSSGTWGVVWRYAFNGDVAVRVRLNGSTIATRTVNNPQSRNYSQSVNIPETALSSGDSLTFQALYNAANVADGRYVDSWSWSLS